MSTEIRGFASGKVRGRLTQETNCVYIALAGEDGNWRGLATPTDDLMAAVAAECDVIVIPRTDLPEVKRASRGDRSFSVGDPNGATTHSAATAEYARERGMGYLAIAEYLDAHPPVDEAQVERIAGLINGVEIDNHDEARRFARRLYANGVRVEAVRP